MSNTFNYNNTNIKSKGNNITGVSKNVFKETLSFIDNKWEYWNNEIKQLESDAHELERMFNNYDRDPKYLELKTDILKKIEFKKNNLINLEQILLDLKIQLERSN
jgi:hypothetical protein